MFCEKVKEFLSQKGVPFVERDVVKDPQAFEELAKLGYLTTPVIVVDGQVVVGFNRKRLEQLLGL
jgi:glutaredoxin 3